MAHLSRLSSIVIDVPAESHDAEVAFWQSALGEPLKRSERYPEYHIAELANAGITFITQYVGEGQPRVHLDVHTTDRSAEVSRLRGLGATVVDDGEQWTVMRDPAGLVFCVIPDRSLTEESARTWSG